MTRGEAARVRAAALDVAAVAHGTDAALSVSAAVVDLLALLEELASDFERGDRR